MRLQRTLTESAKDDYQKYFLDDPDIPDDDKKIISMIHKDCGTFLRSKSRYQKCFRGHKRTFSPYKMLVPRKNRRPSDIPIEVHKIFGEAFQKKFGWNPRTTGVFCAPNTTIAELYGNEHYFYPVGNFKMLYSKGVDDFLNTLKDQGFIKGAQKGWDYTPSNVYDFENTVEEIVSKYEQDTNNAKDALDSWAEIMCQCKSYYMVNTVWQTKYYEAINCICREGFAEGYKP